MLCGMYDDVAIAVKLALVGTDRAEVSLFQDYFEGSIVLAFQNRKMYQLTWYCCICCMQALVNEASAYLKLRNCWGTYVPALISYGTTADGRVVYIATEFIVSSELQKGKFGFRVYSPLDLFA